MARHRALTCDNAARNKEDRRDGATLSARTDAVSLNVTDRREGATLGARTNAVPLNEDEERRRIAAPCITRVAGQARAVLSLVVRLTLRLLFRVLRTLQRFLLIRPRELVLR